VFLRNHFVLKGLRINKGGDSEGRESRGGSFFEEFEIFFKKPVDESRSQAKLPSLLRLLAALPSQSNGSARGSCPLKRKPVFLTSDGL
jgi:hypothetical protein